MVEGFFGYRRPLGVTPLKRSLEFLGYRKFRKVPESFKPERVDREEIRTIPEVLKPRRVSRGEF